MQEQAIKKAMLLCVIESAHLLLN